MGEADREEMGGVGFGVDKQTDRQRNGQTKAMTDTRLEAERQRTLSHADRDEDSRDKDITEVGAKKLSDCGE